MKTKKPVGRKRKKLEVIVQIFNEGEPTQDQIQAHNEFWVKIMNKLLVESNLEPENEDLVVNGKNQASNT